MRARSGAAAGLLLLSGPILNWGVIFFWAVGTVSNRAGCKAHFDGAERVPGACLQNGADRVVGEAAVSSSTTTHRLAPSPAGC
jgi:hypothetical protein